MPPTISEAFSCLKPALAFQQSSEIVGTIAERLGIKPLPVEKEPTAGPKSLKGFGEPESQQPYPICRKVIALEPAKVSLDPEKTDQAPITN